MAGTGSLAYLSRDCEDPSIVGGGLYGSKEVLLEPTKMASMAIRYQYQLTIDTFSLQDGWNYELCTSLTRDMELEPIGVALKFYMSPVRGLDRMVIQNDKYQGFIVDCSGCDEESVVFISDQCETLPVAEPGVGGGLEKGYRDRYTVGSSFLRYSGYFSVLLNTFKLSPGRHYNLCVQQNNELGNAVPDIFVSPLLIAPTWSYRPNIVNKIVFNTQDKMQTPLNLMLYNQSVSYGRNVENNALLTNDYLDNYWLYYKTDFTQGAPLPQYIYPGGFTVCAWYKIDYDANDLTRGKQNFPSNPIIDAERWGLYVTGNVQEGQPMVRD